MRSINRDNNKKKHAGTFGEIGTVSFYPTKNLGSFGDGGCILTNSDKLNNICRRIKNHGSLMRHDHELIGRNSRLDSLQCFVLSTKIKTYNAKIQRRNVLAKIYLKELKNINSLYLPILDFKNNYNTFHQFVIRVKNRRNELMRFLNKEKIDTMIHYPYMLGDLKFYKNCKGVKTLKNSKNLGKKILSLPISEEHSVSEIKYVCKKIKIFFEKKK